MNAKGLDPVTTSEQQAVPVAQEDRIEHLRPPFYIRWTSGLDYETAYLCVEDGEPDMRDFAAVSYGQARLFKAGLEVSASHPCKSGEGAEAAWRFVLNTSTQTLKTRDEMSTALSLIRDQAIKAVTTPSEQFAKSDPNDPQQHDISCAQCLSPDAVGSGGEAREAIAAAIGKADDAFGYSYRMTGLVDGVETHTLFMDGFEPVSFEDRDDGYQVIAERRNRLRADAVLAALHPDATREAELVAAAQEAHDALHECTAVLTASDCKKVAATMTRLRVALNARGGA